MNTGLGNLATTLPEYQRAEIAESLSWPTIKAGYGLSGGARYAVAPVVDEGASYAVAQAEDDIIMGAIESLKVRIRDALIDSVIGFEVERMENAGDSLDFVVLVALVRDVEKARRHELRKELHQMIARSETLGVRERLVVSFR